MDAVYSYFKNAFNVNSIGTISNPGSSCYLSVCFYLLNDLPEPIKAEGDIQKEIVDLLKRLRKGEQKISIAHYKLLAVKFPIKGTQLDSNETLIKLLNYLNPKSGLVTKLTVYKCDCGNENHTQQQLQALDIMMPLPTKPVPLFWISKGGYTVFNLVFYSIFRLSKFFKIITDDNIIERDSLAIILRSKNQIIDVLSIKAASDFTLCQLVSSGCNVYIEEVGTDNTDTFPLFFYFTKKKKNSKKLASFQYMLYVSKTGTCDEIADIIVRFIEQASGDKSAFYFLQPGISFKADSILFDVYDKTKNLEVLLNKDVQFETIVNVSDEPKIGKEVITRLATKYEYNSKMFVSCCDSFKMTTVNVTYKINSDFFFLALQKGVSEVHKGDIKYHKISYDNAIPERLHDMKMAGVIIYYGNTISGHYIYKSIRNDQVVTIDDTKVKLEKNSNPIGEGQATVVLYKKSLK